MQDVLPHVSDLWPRTIDTGQYVGTIFLGLAKVFDCACVNHDMHIIIILLQRLNHYGIWEDAYEWMKSFLYGRTQ